jgi:hypothetical protein
MQFLNKWERKFGWLSFPGFLRFYAMFHVMVYLLQFVNPEIGRVLEFDKDKILSGEVWRIVTFLFSSSGSGGVGAFGALFLFFMVMIAFMMSDALEGAWGVFRTSMFYYTGYIGLILANFLYPKAMDGSGFFIYTSAFFAFATLFPKVEFLLFLIIPVQIRWLAMLIALFYVIDLFQAPIFTGYFLLCFGNYLLWAGIPALRGRGQLIKAGRRRKHFQKASSRDEDAFHRCAECSRTDVSDPDLEFRMSMDGKEYCTDHLKD